MFNYYFNVGLIYTIIGFSIALICFFLLKKNVFGRFWGALIIALVGSFLGGVIDYVFEDLIAMLANINNSVNIFPPIISSIILVLIFSRVSEKK